MKSNQFRQKAKNAILLKKGDSIYYNVDFASEQSHCPYCAWIFDKVASIVWPVLVTILAEPSPLFLLFFLTHSWLPSIPLSPFLFYMRFTLYSRALGLTLTAWTLFSYHKHSHGAIVQETINSCCIIFAFEYKISTSYHSKMLFLFKGLLIKLSFTFHVPYSNRTQIDRLGDLNFYWIIRHRVISNKILA